MKSLYNRHNKLVKEMEKRGYNHNSNLEYINFSNYDEKTINYKIDRNKSLIDLLTRCVECKKRYKEMIK
jgi:hypothetical protein